MRALRLLKCHAGSVNNSPPLLHRHLSQLALSVYLGVGYVGLLQRLSASLAP